MLLLPWGTQTQVQGTRCKRLLSKHRAIYNLCSCPTPSVDSRDIKHIKRIIQTQAAEDRHTHTHTPSLTLLKPALIRGITEASSLSGLKERTHVVTQTPPWQICLENIRSLLHMTGCRPADARWVRHFNSDNTPNHEEKDKKRAERKEGCTYLFTTATITVFSEELTALIDLNVNRGSLLASEQEAGGKAHGIKSMYFSVFHAPILPGRQSPVVELCEQA